MVDLRVDRLPVSIEFSGSGRICWDNDRIARTVLLEGEPIVEEQGCFRPAKMAVRHIPICKNCDEKLPAKKS